MKNQSGNEKYMKSLLKISIAEIIGTAVLVLFGCGVAIATNCDTVATSLAFGLSIVAMAYSAAAPGLQDPAGQAADSLFNEAFKKWASAKKDSFEYFSAWTAMVRGANHLFARLEKIERMFS